MAEVYKAYQPGLDRYVAVKVMHSHLADDEDFVGRFQREALAVAKLRHPNIVTVFDFGDLDGMYYMVMEFVEGPTLKDEIAARTELNQAFELAEVVRIFTSLCNAIHYAHSRRMIHRDLKPANVMLTKEGQVILTDFGIARMVGGTKYTMTGAISGTPAYMAPEQGEGQRGDERSDIYSLGVILYQMLTGRVPFDADTPFAVIMKHINEPLPLPRKVSSNISEEMEAAILKALAKDPNDRFQSGAEMARAIREAAKLPVEETHLSVPITTLAGAPVLRGELNIDDATFTRAAQTSEETAAATATPTILSQVGSNRGLQFALGLIALLVLGGLVTAGIFLTRGPAATPTAPVATVAQLDQEAVAQTAVARIEATQNARLTATAEAAAAAGIDTPTPAPPTATNTPDLGATAAVQTAAAVGAIESFIATQTAQAPTQTPTPVPTDTPVPTNTSPPTNTPTVGPTNTPRPPTPTPAPAGPSVSNLSGRLAVPVDNAGRYDVFIFSIPDGRELAKIIGVRQPYFRSDGKLLVNGEAGPTGGGAGDNVFMYNADGSGGTPISGSPGDGYPTWSPDGGRIAYDNPRLVLAKTGGPTEWHLFVQPGLTIPDTNEMASFNVIAGDIFDAGQPLFPLWAADDFLIFRACDIWPGGGGGSRCAVWRTPSWATVRGDGYLRPALVTDLNAIPTDTQDAKLLVMSQASGNWEVYATTITGGGVTNLTNNPTQDGLGTLSPDGQWVAFVSDRGGSWAVWVVPFGGGQPSKLFDLPRGNPWGAGERDWTRERISWGP